MSIRFFVMSLLVACSPLQAAERPNILFIQTDDQASWSLGLDNPEAATPHMDRLFSEGLRLTNCFTVTPVCSPSRASLMTSRYGSELGITDWINRRVEPTLGMDPDLPNWVRLIRASGYRTALIGKWHLGTEDAFHPLQQGFDHFMGHREGGWQTENPVLEKEGVETKLSGLTTDILADEVIAYLEASPKEKPFLLCWHTRAPHTRWLPVAEEDWAPFESLDPTVPNPDYPKLNKARVKKMTREYHASVRGVDRNLGRVLASIEALGLRENTVVIFTSDHGYCMGHNGIWHKGNGHWVLTQPPAGSDNIPKGQRPNLYDHSLRVPTAIRWPGKIAAGGIFDGKVSNLDWFPTLLKIAGVDLPTDAKLRGRPIPLEPTDNVAEEVPFFAQYSTHHQSRTQMRAIRTSSWKLVRDFLNPHRDEMYDLANDPEERENLILSEKPAVMAKREALHGELIAWMKSIQDPALPDAHEVLIDVGTGEAGYAGDQGTAKKAQLNNPFGLVRGPDGCLYVCDTGNHAIRKIDEAGVIHTVAGTGVAGYSGDGGPATEAQLYEPYEIRFDQEGHLFAVEMKNHLIRRIDAETGIISTVAGTGEQGFSGDGGPALEARFSRPHSIAFGPNGDLYVCDIGNHRLRKIDRSTGRVSTVSGTGEKALPEDGQAFAGAPLLGPRAIDFDAAGHLWLALREGNRLYQLRLNKGTLHWMAGTGKKGFGGHGGPAKKAPLSGPKGVSIGPDGRVYLADTESHSVRVYDPKSRILSCLAGDGTVGLFARLHGIFVDQDGSVYVGDSENHQVKVIRRKP